jgi:hypothetical protein
LCKAKVAEEVSFPPDYDPDASKRFDAKKHDQWRSAEEARMVVVKTVEEDGFSRQLTSIADLDDLGPDQLGSVEGYRHRRRRMLLEPSAPDHGVGGSWP